MYNLLYICYTLEYSVILCKKKLVKIYLKCWLALSILFSFSRVKISETKSDDGMTNLLEILQTETSDGAIYQCRAGNPYGADVYSVYLTILGMNINYITHLNLWNIYSINLGDVHSKSLLIFSCYHLYITYNYLNLIKYIQQFVLKCNWFLKLFLISRNKSV